MKKLTMSMALLLLSGCEVSEMKRSKQDQVCHYHGGVYDYRHTYRYVECNDATLQDWRDVVLAGDFIIKNGARDGK